MKNNDKLLKELKIKVFIISLLFISSIGLFYILMLSILKVDPEVIKLSFYVVPAICLFATCSGMFFVNMLLKDESYKEKTLESYKNKKEK